MIRRSAAVACILLFITSAAQSEVGFTFGHGVSPEIGVKVHVGRVYCLHTSGMFSFDSDGNDIVAGVELDNQFYLPDLKQLRHYLSIAGIWTMESRRRHTVGFSPGYGLQFNVNESFGVYGQVGLLATFRTPRGEFVGGLLSTGLGFVFYPF